MTRSDLRRLVEELGGEGFRLSPALRPVLEQKLREYFESPEGQATLAKAPRINRNGVYGQMTVDDAVSLLLSEVEFKEATP